MAIIEIIVMVAAGFALGVLFMEVRMSLFARLAALEATAKSIVENAAGNVERAVETVSLDAFNAVKSTLEGVVSDIAALKAAIGSESDAPTSTTTTSTTASTTGEPAAEIQQIGPAATESTGAPAS
ncbi:hypothetical protein [Novosphingobium sp. FSW06-99]|uniref:hypothetical protein n=1 Tax=Novosphingobium sp. FSW06-99 TaxID=1739113 RepID=UPI00076D89FC|nr:hypothetical protein [Novosphingobium sp. FSW06-99]KUR80897.1 hypothetical protein AQZ49_02420 [Novosphingobium sp. FSW06-99]